MLAIAAGEAAACEFMQKLAEHGPCTEVRFPMTQSSYSSDRQNFILY